MDGKIREELNHMAYMDVLDRKEPQHIESEYYMSCYRFWQSTCKSDYSFDQEDY